MRGKLKKGVLSLGETRITPADAGKTYRGGFTFANPRDHPRGCGENFLYADTDSLHLGSPPRMRGKLTEVVLLLQILGITPADAGKTFYMRILIHCI